MAILDESVGTTTSSADLSLSIRRRPRPSTDKAASTDVEVSDTSTSKMMSSLEAESLVNGLEQDRSQIDGGGGRVENELSNSNANDGEEKVGNGEQREEAVNLAKFMYRPSAPAHKRIKESPLSSDAIFKQYGWLIQSGFWFSSRSLRDWPLLMCCLSLPIFPVAAFIVEKLAQRKYISEPVVVTLHILITSATILYPVFMILRFDSAVLSGVTLMLFACIVWLKLVSYAHTNYDMRVLAKSVDKGEASSVSSTGNYCYDVSFECLIYFMVAPTLCYQTSYPRTACIRKGWLVRQVIKLVIFTGFMGFIVEQYINPIVKNSQHPLKGNLLYAIERVLKLSVPNLYVWLCMFYCFFHLWLNILAELLRFGDREFYKDWWNAKTVEEVDLMLFDMLKIFVFIFQPSVTELTSGLIVFGRRILWGGISYQYWRMWNMPVHKWMVRHVYFPCLRNGIPKGIAVLIAFVVSAIFHELCIAVPCHIFKFWAFIGIMLQVPLVMITSYLQDKFSNSMVGNMIFWCFFSIFGQPMCLLLYYHDLMNRKVNTA